ncbi:hypothetical protein BJ741DRAFT_666615 [Chytriomyces cf. hyalinus JEL632]|nr:hypothetical protein BJ741DRAFT_666615 [Chytriomyces cf. hyalinus JEL632]
MSNMNISDIGPKTTVSLSAQNLALTARDGAICLMPTTELQLPGRASLSTWYLVKLWGAAYNKSFRQEGTYLSISNDGNQTLGYSDVPFCWDIKLEGVPVVSLLPLKNFCLDSASATDLPPALHSVMLQCIRAHQDVGFFYVVGHGTIMGSLLDFVHDAYESLTSKASPHTINFSANGRAELYDDLTVPQEFGNTDVAQRIDEMVNTCYDQLVRLVQQITTLFAYGEFHLTGCKAEWFNGLIPPSHVVFRAMGYGPGSSGVHDHADETFFTVLSASRSGLEIHRKQDHWIHVPEMKEALFINSGRALCKLSNGLFPAVRHRVRASDVDEPMRVSIPFFCNHEAGLHLD